MDGLQKLAGIANMISHIKKLSRTWLQDLRENKMESKEIAAVCAILKQVKAIELIGNWMMRHAEHPIKEGRCGDIIKVCERLLLFDQDGW